MDKSITTTSKEDWEQYISKSENWEKVYINSPISNLRFRNNTEHLILGCVASGTSLYARDQHCGGIDHVCYSLKDKMYKIDRFAIFPEEQSDKFEIVMLDKNNYKEIHHIGNTGDLLKQYPKLKIFSKRGK